MKTNPVFCYIFAILVTLPVTAAEVKGLLDVRAVSGDDTTSWLHQGLGKQRFDETDNGLQLGQAVLDVSQPLAATLNARLDVNAYTNRNSKVDVSDAFLQWKPLPIEGYRFKARAGAFFMPISLENTGPGWTSPWMLSTSAINTWIGEEFRTMGVELSFARPGQFHDSPHSVEILGSVFAVNDPAGTLLAWRGWSVGDRISGLNEHIDLPDISVYKPEGPFSRQAPSEKPFKEIDHRAGYYVGLHYDYENWMRWQWLHYDNRADPTAFHEGQYGWTTRFDHLGLRLDLPYETTVLTQWINGSTRMGAQIDRSVRANFHAAYCLISKATGDERWTLRYDRFQVDDRDLTPEDNNAERGYALALGWQHRLRPRHVVGAEGLLINSVHAGRAYLHGADNETATTSWLREDSWQLFYRYAF